MASPDDYLAEWRQGDILQRGRRRLVLLSRTCDIVRSIDDRPNVYVAPAEHRPDDDQAHLWRRPQWLPLPAYEDGKWCADLDQIDQIHKRRLRRCKPKNFSVETGEQDRFFRRHLGRYLSKPSWEEYVERTLEPITKRMRSKYSKQSPEGSLIADVLDIRITVVGGDLGPRDHTTERGLLVSFVMAPEAMPLVDDHMIRPSAETEQWFGQSSRGLSEIAERRSMADNDGEFVWLLEKYAARLVDECEPHYPVVSVEWELVAHDVFSFDRVKESSPIEVEYLSYRT